MRTTLEAAGETVENIDALAKLAKESREFLQILLRAWWLTSDSSRTDATSQIIVQTMNQRTSEKLSELKSFPWFMNVGKAAGGDYMFVRNWNEAVELVAAEVWSSVQHQAKNRIAEEVAKRDYRRLQGWNVVATELQKEIAAIVTNSVEPLEKAFRLKPDFRGAVSWDILLICLETEFSDLVSPMFFVPRLQPVYAAGHFPCGWEGPKVKEGWQGELPNSRLIIY